MSGKRERKLILTAWKLEHGAHSSATTNSSTSQHGKFEVLTREEEKCKSQTSENSALNSSPLNSAHQLPSTVECPRPTWYCPFPPHLLEYGRMSKQNYRSDEFQTITHLTASLPAREPLLGCSGVGGVGGRGKSQKPGNREPRLHLRGPGTRVTGTVQSSHPLLSPALSPSLPEP